MVPRAGIEPALVLCRSTLAPRLPGFKKYCHADCVQIVNDYFVYWVPGGTPCFPVFVFLFSYYLCSGSKAGSLACRHRIHPGRTKRPSRQSKRLGRPQPAPHGRHQGTKPMYPSVSVESPVSCAFCIFLNCHLMQVIDVQILRLFISCKKHRPRHCVEHYRKKKPLH